MSISYPRDTLYHLRILFARTILSGGYFGGNNLFHDTGNGRGEGVIYPQGGFCKSHLVVSRMWQLFFSPGDLCSNGGGVTHHNGLPIKKWLLQNTRVSIFTVQLPEMKNRKLLTLTKTNNESICKKQNGRHFEFCGHIGKWLLIFLF